MAFYQQAWWKVTLEVDNVVADITDDVYDSITVENKMGYLSTASFTLKRGLFYLDVLNYYQKIKIWGGGLNQKENSPLLFSGFIKTIQAEFPASGIVTVSLSCFSGDAGKISAKSIYTYPSKNCLRPWAKKDTITASDIVRNIAKEMGILIAKKENRIDEDLLIEPEITFSNRHPVKQCYETDWTFLTNFVKKCGCVMWETYNESGLVELHVAPSTNFEKLSFDQTIKFVYVGRDDESFGRKGKTTINKTTYEINAVDELKGTYIQMWTCNISEDASAMFANIRTYSNYNEDGEEITTSIFEVYDPETQQYYYYELDQEKMQALNNEEINMLVYNIANVSKEYIQALFKKVLQKSRNSATSEEYESLKPVGSPYIGIRITGALCDGDARIQPMVNYQIIGIGGRYEKRFTKWLLTSIKHNLGPKGYYMEVSFNDYQDLSSV